MAPKKRGHHVDLHNMLIKNGYSYVSSKGAWNNSKKEYPLGRTITYRDKKGNIAIQKLVKKGKKPQRVNLRINRRLTQTRVHGTPDIYEVTYKKKKKRKK